MHTIMPIEQVASSRVSERFFIFNLGMFFTIFVGYLNKNVIRIIGYISNFKTHWCFYKKKQPLKNSAIFIAFWSEWTKKWFTPSYNFCSKATQLTARYAKLGVRVFSNWNCSWSLGTREKISAWIYSLQLAQLIPLGLTSWNLCT